MTISIVAGIGKEREIGVEGDIPWDLYEDRKRFFQLTRNHTVIMGRNTFESVMEAIGTPFPRRRNIIITSNPDYQAPEGCIVVHSIEEALAATNPEEETFVVGGATIYEQTLPLVDKLYLTEVDENYPNADSFFPVFDLSEWTRGEAVEVPNKPEDQPYATFVIYEGKKQNGEG